MNEVSLFRMQEDEGFGLFLIESIAKPLGLPTDIKAIEKAVYKGTACGAWVKFDAQGILVGTIVEGSDAEYSERVSIKNLQPSDEDEVELNRRFWEAIKRCETFADEYFQSDT